MKISFSRKTGGNLCLVPRETKILNNRQYFIGESDSPAQNKVALYVHTLFFSTHTIK